jgi:hypothetical protein
MIQSVRTQEVGTARFEENVSLRIASRMSKINALNPRNGDDRCT